MHPKNKIFRNIVWLTQLGISLVSPLILCIGVCYWLQNRFSIGPWLMVVGIVAGLGGSVSSALRFYHIVRRQSEQQSKKRNDAFNSHE